MFAYNPGCLTSRERVGSVRVCQPYQPFRRSSSSPVSSTPTHPPIVSVSRFSAIVSPRPPRAFRSRGLFIWNVENVQTTAQRANARCRGRNTEGNMKNKRKSRRARGRRSKRIFIDRIGRCFQSNLGVCGARGRVRDFVANRRDITARRVRRDVRVELALCSILLSKQNVPLWLAFPHSICSVLFLAILRLALPAESGKGRRGW